MNPTLTVVVRATLAEHGVTSYRDIANVIQRSKDAVGDRCRNEVEWTLADLERVAEFAGIEIDQLVRHYRRAVA